MLAPSRDRKWSYRDYRSWPEEERWELIDGVAYAMAPAPGRRHQLLVSELLYLLRSRLSGTGCQIYPAPFDVRLGEPGASDEQVLSVVQPDISVFCSDEHLDERGGNGPPDLIIEILSPSTSAKDTITKRALYQRSQVPEYWIVDPETEEVYRFVLRGRQYDEPRVYRQGETLEASTLEGVRLEIDRLFGR